jgi:SHS2 domain-containing protein
MPYTLIEHTADTGIKVSAPAIGPLFEEAARGLADIMGARTHADDEKFTVEAQGIDREDLLVRWLQEILFLVEVRGFRLRNVSVKALTGTEIRAEVRGSYSGVPLESEIKAVTYHRLKIQEIDNGYEVSIIFDI